MEHRCRALLGSLVALALATAVSASAQNIEEAIALHLEGELDRALEAYDRVISDAERQRPNVVAAAHTNSCLIHMNRSHYEAALAACESALRLRRQTGDIPRTATTLNNLGLTLQSLGRYREARERFLEALGINREVDPERAAQNLSNQAGLAIQAGAYGEALDRVSEVLELAAEHPGAEWHHPQRRIALLNEGVTLEKLGAFRAALESYRRALAEGDSMDDSFEALLTVNLGVIYRNLGDPLRAVELFEEAAAVYRRLDNASGLSNTLLNIGLARHLNLDQPEGAERAYREALALAEAAGDRPEEVQDLFYLGTLLVEQDRLDEAHELFARALATAEASGSAEGEWSALYGLGRIAVARGELESGVAHFNRALEAIEGVRAALDADGHRGQFFGEKRPVFEAAVSSEAATESGGAAERSFSLVQRAKARELLDALGEPRAEHRFEAGDIGKALDSDALLIEYFVAEGRLLRWRLDRRDGLALDDLGEAREILATVTRVHRALAGSSAPAAADLEQLSERLLGGVGPLAGRPLLIAPDGALRYLPFELLNASGKPVIDVTTTTYLPSGSALTSLAPPTEHPRFKSVALGNPRIPTSGRGARPAALLAARFGLRELPATEREVATLERRLGKPARALLGEQATEAALREATAAGSRVVHLAAHTVIDERLGRGAAVLLTPAGDDDGLLYPREIAALDLRTDLAVLAGCRTALAEGAAGSSLASLTGAFLAAGASGVVATLWEVGDETTAAFMDQFYWHLSRGATPAEALRRSKLRFLEQQAWRAPHLWAGYVLIGDPPAIAGRGVPWWWIAGGAIALAAVALLVGRRRRTAVY